METLPPHHDARKDRVRGAARSVAGKPASPAFSCVSSNWTAGLRRTRNACGDLPGRWNDGRRVGSIAPAYGQLQTWHHKYRNLPRETATNCNRLQWLDLFDNVVLQGVLRAFWRTSWLARQARGHKFESC